MGRLLDTVNPYLWASLIGTYHTRPLPYLLGNSPTIGQALYIAIFVILNVVLTSVNSHRSQPHPWYFSPKEELLAYIGYRTGHISYALLPLVILLSSRNNFLLWITNWSHSTYMLLHRWVARVYALHAIIHSITLLITYTGTGSYPTDSKQPYWLWGIVATVLTCAMLVFSHLYFRRLCYEVFLVLHILMGVFVIVGCWYHVILKWGYNFYDNWLIATPAVWFFDRLLRALRIAKNGVKRAVVTSVDADHVRIDIPGLRFPSQPGYVGYVYFPTLTPYRPWENHPFSVNSSSLFCDQEPTSGRTSLVQSRVESEDDVEKQANKGAGTIQTKPVTPSGTGTPVEATVSTAGITLIVKKNKGLTHTLGPSSSLITLLEGPYRYHPSKEVLACDRVLLIGGGIGITGLLAWAHAHPNVKLAWSVKSSAEALVREVKPALAFLKEQQVQIGERLDVDALLRAEVASGCKRVGVVVCGPGGMCDDVRARVAALGRRTDTKFELEVEAFSW